MKPYGVRRQDKRRLPHRLSACGFLRGFSPFFLISHVGGRGGIAGVLTFIQEGIIPAAKNPQQAVRELAEGQNGLRD
jgi:hypothetical protein